MKAIILCMLLIYAGVARVDAIKEPPRHVPAHLKTDGEIQAAVVKGLLANPYVSAARIRVHVSRGVVTLEGRVKTNQAKKMAGQVARAVSGVRGVRNQLIVDSPRH